MALKQYIPAIKYGNLLANDEMDSYTPGNLASNSLGNTVYPVVPANGTVVAQTGDATLAASDLNKITTNTGASGTITLTLPAVAGLAGYCQRVTLLAAQIVRLDPAGTESIFLNGSGVAGKYVNIAGVIGNYANIYCDGSRWLVLDYAGVVTKEA